LICKTYQLKVALSVVVRDGVIRRPMNGNVCETRAYIRDMLEAETDEQTAAIENIIAVVVA